MTAPMQVVPEVPPCPFCGTPDLSALVFQLNGDIDTLEKLIAEKNLEIDSLRESLWELESQLATRTPAQVALTVDQVRAAGGIVHRDGNVFFTNLGMLNAAIDAAIKAGEA